MLGSVLDALLIFMEALAVDIVGKSCADGW